MPVQTEKACAAEANSRLELGKVRRTAEPLPAKVRRGEIDFRLRAGGTIPSLKSRLSNRRPRHAIDNLLFFATAPANVEGTQPKPIPRAPISYIIVWHARTVDQRRDLRAPKIPDQHPTYNI